MKIVELDIVDSTNLYAKEQARLGIEDQTVIWAHQQTLGRGRHGNSWVSPKGNLYMSLIVHHKLDKKDIGQLSFISSVAILNVLEKLLPPEHKISLKWPNDVLLDEKKLSGILIETESGANWAVIGVGVNIMTAPEGAIALADIGIEVTAKELLWQLSNEIIHLMTKVEKEGFEFVRDRWMLFAYKLGEEIKARFSNKTISGKFKCIDKNGVLCLEMNDGTMLEFSSGEVFL